MIGLRTARIAEPPQAYGSAWLNDEVRPTDVLRLTDEAPPCLEAGGLTTSTDSVIPADARKMLGIEGSLTLSGDGDLVGLGSVTWYVGAMTATEAHEASALSVPRKSSEP